MSYIIIIYEQGVGSYYNKRIQNKMFIFLLSIVGGC